MQVNNIFKQSIMFAVGIFLLPLCVLAASLQAINLHAGVNDIPVKFDGIKVKIVKGTTGSINGTGFDIFSVYVIENGGDGTWYQVPFFDKNSSVSYMLNDKESLDATMQSVMFYKKNNKLNVVVAMKYGLDIEKQKKMKSKIKFVVYEFYNKYDGSSFDQIETKYSNNKYFDAGDAVRKEFN